MKVLKLMIVSAVAAVLVYFNAHLSLWAPVTDVVLVIGYGAAVAMTPPRVTGRQAYLTSLGEVS